MKRPMADALSTDGPLPGKRRSLSLVMRAAESLLLAVHDERVVVHTAVALLGDQFGYHMRFVMLWHPREAQLVMAEAAGPGADELPTINRRVALGEGLTGRAAQTLRPMSSSDIDRPSPVPHHGTPPASFLAVPVHVRGELLGVIGLESEIPEAFDTGEIEVLVAFSQILALALSYARVNKRHSRDLAELQAINQVAREATALDLDRTLDTAVRTYMEATTSDSTAIHLFDPLKKELKCVAVAFDPTLFAPDYGRIIRAKPRPLGEGLNGWVALHRQAAIIDDSLTDPRSLRVISPESHSLIAVPLMVEDRLLGVIRTLKHGVASYTQDHFRFAQTLAHQVALAIAAAQAHEEAMQRSLTDDLTGLANTRAFNARLREEVDRALRYGRPLTLLMLDSDVLKYVNDTLGHATGDEFLRELARRMRATVRSTDFIARYGGDEFVVLLLETGIEEGLAKAEVIRAAAVQDLGLGVAGTVSIGVSAIDERRNNAEDLFRAADAALYEAKRAGKNRIARMS